MPASLTAARPQPTATTPLFSPFRLGGLRLPNRILMAPLTRARADAHGVPSGLAAEYYTQRAAAGLIIAEATAVSRQGTGYHNWPGLYTVAQEAGWQTITDAVHAAGGRIFVQLFHADSAPAGPIESITLRDTVTEAASRAVGRRTRPGRPGWPWPTPQ
jgi:N-ethylmaleimide reductase